MAWEHYQIASAHVPMFQMDLINYFYHVTDESGKKGISEKNYFIATKVFFEAFDAPKIVCFNAGLHEDNALPTRSPHPCASTGNHQHQRSICWNVKRKHKVPRINIAVSHFHLEQYEIFSVPCEGGNYYIGRSGQVHYSCIFAHKKNGHAIKWCKRHLLPGYDHNLISFDNGKFYCVGMNTQTNGWNSIKFVIDIFFMPQDGQHLYIKASEWDSVKHICC